MSAKSLACWDNCRIFRLSRPCKLCGHFDGATMLAGTDECLVTPGFTLVKMSYFIINPIENELLDLTTRLEEKARAYRMEVSSEKSKVLVNSNNQNTPINIMMNCQNLEEVHSNTLESTLSKDGTSTKEIKISIAVAMSAMSRLNTILKSRDTSFKPSLNSTEHLLYPGFVFCQAESYFCQS